MNPRFDSPSLVSLERGRTAEILGLNWFSSFHFSNGHAAGAQKSCFPRAPSPSRIRCHPPHRDAPSPLITTILARATLSLPNSYVYSMKEYPHSCSSSCTTYPASRVPPRPLASSSTLFVSASGPPPPGIELARASDAGPSSSRISSMRNPPCLAPVSSLALAGPASAPSRRRSGDGGTLTLGLAGRCRIRLPRRHGYGPGPRPPLRPGRTPRFPRVNTGPWLRTRQEEIRGAF